jgi:hypothetical protein
MFSLCWAEPPARVALLTAGFAGGVDRVAAGVAGAAGDADVAGEAGAVELTTVPPCAMLALLEVPTACLAALIADWYWPAPWLAPECDPSGLSMVIHSAKNATVPTSRAINGLETLSISVYFGIQGRRHEVF